MGKTYDDEANHHTVSHLREKTILLGAFYLIAGVNGILAFILALIQEMNRGHTIGLLVISIVMLAMVFSVRDHRRENRDLVAVIGAGVVCVFCNGMYTKVLSVWYFPVICLGEGLLLAGALLLRHSLKNRRRKKSR